MACKFFMSDHEHIGTVPKKIVSTRLDPRKLSTLTEILTSLSEFQSEETELSNSLGHLIASREPIQASLDRLHTLLPDLNDLHRDATGLSGKVSQTAKTADRVGGRVRSLDEEMRRVREAADRVSQVMELKSSLLDLDASIASRDWESAALHCARAMALPLDVLSGSFAEKAVPTEESHLPPAQTLETAREHLLTVFRENFEKASSARDSAATSRFFKLFPAIGWETEGLQAYADFVTELIRVPSALNNDSSPLYYVSSLTALFESIVMIVDQHQPVVEKYYGAGKMKTVVNHLLQECDRILRKLIDDWEEDRAIRRKLADVASNPPTSMGTRNRLEDDAVDPRDLDKVISEIAAMASRWNLFRKLLADMFTEDSDNDSENGTPKEMSDTPATSQFLAMESTVSHAAIEGILSNYYLPLETWYLRTIIDKAHKLSTPDFSQVPPSTTTPDDVFYVLKLVINRLLSTGSLSVVQRSFIQLRDILERDYAGTIKKKLDDVYRNSGPAASGSRGEKADREARVSFIASNTTRITEARLILAQILLNDLDISSSHLDRLLQDVSSSSILHQHFIQSQVLEVKIILSNFSAASTKLRGVLRVGVEQLFNQLLRPRLRNFIVDVYKDVSYILDDDAYSSAEYQDIVRKRFVKAWDSLVEVYRDTFTESNHRKFFGLALDVLLRPWEKHLLSLKYTELGAIRFDRDLRAIISYLTGQTVFGDTREKFVRLQQISTLLNLDTEEDVDEFYNGSGITWKLSIQEARSVAGLKV